MLKLLQRYAKQLSLVKGTIREKQKLLNEQLDRALTPFFRDDNTESQKGFEYQLRVAILRMWEYGAVSALQVLGFQATSRRVTNMKKSFVSKNADPKKKLRFRLVDRDLLSEIGVGMVSTVARASTQVLLQVRRVIRDQLILGSLTVQETANFLKAGSGFPDRYAQKIAKTEIHQAFESAQYETYKRSGVKRHFWVTVGDDRVRPQHVNNEAAGSVIVGNFFPSGQRWPGEGVLSINCRCSVIPDTSIDDRIRPWTGDVPEFKLAGGPKSAK